MKFLFTAGGSHSTVFSMAPLATAARTAGHDVLLTVDEPVLEAAEAIGVPAVPVPHPGEAAARLDALLDLSRDWTPDVVVGGLSYVPGLLATYLGVPYVRQYWDIVPLRPEPALPVLLERVGLDAPPEHALFIDVCPPALRPSPTPGARPMRWVPRNRQLRLEPWMYTRPKGRPRVLITAGTRAAKLRNTGDSTRRLVDGLRLTGAEVLVAAPPGAAEQFGTELGDVRVGWLPLDVVAPTCDLMVHHGGAATAMTGAAAGTPQLITPENNYAKEIARAFTGFGGARTVVPEDRPQEDPGEVIAESCREILADPAYAERAAALRQEIAALPTPYEMVAELEGLAAG
ncbi:glycosyltransferase [Streptomyces xiamenensis]|uniref:glycosyltransferase n=1 Tax=Streptomyces xiamenensis TaxID=408015 RepID=UPI0036778B36